MHQLFMKVKNTEPKRDVIINLETLSVGTLIFLIVKRLSQHVWTWAFVWTSSQNDQRFVACSKLWCSVDNAFRTARSRDTCVMQHYGIVLLMSILKKSIDITTFKKRLKILLFNMQYCSGITHWYPNHFILRVVSMLHIHV